MSKLLPDRIPVPGDGTFKLLDIDRLHIKWIRTLISGLPHRWVYDSDVEVSKPLRLQKVVAAVKGQSKHLLYLDADIYKLLEIWMCLENLRTGHTGLPGLKDVKPFLQSCLMNFFSSWLHRHKTHLYNMAHNPEIVHCLQDRFGKDLWNLIQDIMTSQGDNIFSKDTQSTTTMTTTIPEVITEEISTLNTPTTSPGANLD